MVQETWELQKYVTETGVCPFDEWFDTLDSTTKARIDVRFDRVIMGNFGDYKSVGEGIYQKNGFKTPSPLASSGQALLGRL